MSSLRKLFSNRWFKFCSVTIIYLLWFILWSGYYWMLIGVAVIYDIYISKLYLKLFWNKHTRLKSENSLYKSVAGWVEAILFALVFATLIRTYFLEMYVIPTGSMEGTLKIGDYLGVSKVTYGPKMPNTPIAIPLVHNVTPWNLALKSYSELIKLPYKRLKGFKEVEREDIVVFNYPEGDTVVVGMPQNNYYQLVRSYGRDKLLSQAEIMSHPVDRRDNYIKRAVAIHGDTFQVIDGVVYVDGKKESDIEGKQYMYNITTESGASPFSSALVEELDLTANDTFATNTGFGAFLTAAAANRVSNIKGVTSVKKYNSQEAEIDIFPHRTDLYPWSVDNFGPLKVPSQGETISLTLDNLPLYQRIIGVYEENKLEVKGEDIYINDQKSDRYTFKMNYFFMMGDNRHNSLDSRYWGFVPDDHIVGTPAFIWLSIDENKSFPSNIRFSRIFKNIE